MAHGHNDGTVINGSSLWISISPAALKQAGAGFDLAALGPALIDFVGGEDAASYNPDYMGIWCAEVLLRCKDTFELGQWAERVAAFLRSRGAPRGTVLVAEFGREWAVEVFPDGK